MFSERTIGRIPDDVQLGDTVIVLPAYRAKPRRYQHIQPVRHAVYCGPVTAANSTGKHVFARRSSRGPRKGEWIAYTAYPSHIIRKEDPIR